ncbi:carboxypeptidase regulatory-like domain-containing protein [Fulvivirgaceae bacterium LMO-SS25]
MKRLIRLSLLSSAFMLLIMTSCVSQQTMQASKQGLFGKVLWVAGNQMPMIIEEGQQDDRKGPRPIEREIVVFEQTRTSDTEMENGFYKNIKTKEVARFKTDKNGQFFINLKPGVYSLFTVEEDGLWANTFDGKNRINPIEIKEDEISQITITINYEAAY